ncbi:MAG TPA: FG-GAP-like repeat-containing protein, partial [Elusimicrobiota bacterium]|nr:FG-GAP-like repeat-containing protein [Elusimicrobiota bacterium]
VTGALLGRVRVEVAEGEIKDVSDKFSTGELLSRKADVAAGQRARLTSPPPAAAPATAAAGPGLRAPKSMGATVPYEINAMAVGDFDKIGRPQLVLADENTVYLYSYPLTDAKPLSQMTIPGTGLRIVGLESGDLDGDGGDELFVSVFDQTFNRFETRVLSMQNGRWLKVADLPFLTRSYQDATGKRVLASQQVIDDRSFPFGAIYPLAYRDEKYEQGRPALKLRRVDWLFDFTTAQIGAGAPAVLYYTSVHRLRVQFGKEWWPTPDDDYGQTPVRIRWQGRLLEFNPPLAVTYGPKGGFEDAYAVRNMAALGGLASPFGLFNHAELTAKRWNGLGLETAWKADLSGCAQGLAVVDDAGHKELAVAVRGSAGQSSVWIFEP